MFDTRGFQEFPSGAGELVGFFHSLRVLHWRDILYGTIVVV